MQTQDNLQYQFYPVSSGSVQFKVRAANDAHIALTMGPQESEPIVEVIFLYLSNFLVGFYIIIPQRHDDE